MNELRFKIGDIVLITHRPNDYQFISSAQAQHWDEHQDQYPVRGRVSNVTHDFIAVSVPSKGTMHKFKYYGAENYLDKITL